MANLNKVILIGNLTRDPEARRTNSGTSVCRLGLAVNRRYRDASGEQREETTFVDIDVWGRQADFCRDYLRKGAPVYVDGRLRLDQWEDRATGQKRSRLCVVAESVQSLGGRDSSSGGGNDQQSSQNGGYQQQGPDSSQQQGWNNAPQQQSQPSAPPPPPFPSQPQQGQAPPAPSAPSAPPASSAPASTPDTDAFDVSDEPIDDIPF